MSQILEPRLPVKDWEADPDKTQRFSLPGILKPQAPATEESVPLPAIAGYEVIDVLGRGGYGVVYKALQVKVKRLVALKMILAGPHAGPSDLARFRTEAEAVGNLQHPNIVQIFEVGEQDGHSFFSLEYIDGGNLEEKLQGTPMASRQAAELVETLARAMHHAHEHGIIHRDLKPANVLLSADGTPKITDFGLAKKLDSEQGFTRTGAAVGTPAYMAPEQAMGQTKTLGPAVDIYALGAILYQMLTGRVPFVGDNPVDVMIRVASEEPMPPSRLLSKVARDLETICLKCLEKEPHRRYRTAQALADDLARFLNHEPILARPVNFLERCFKWARRRKMVTALLAGIAFTSIGLLAAWGFYKQSVDRHQQAERRHEQEELAEITEAISRGRLAAKYQLWGNLQEIVAAIENKNDFNVSLLEKLDPANLEARDDLKRRLDAHKVYEKFIKSREEALFFATLSVGEQAPEKIPLALKKTREALSYVGLSDSVKSELTLDDGYSPEEKTDIRKGCYHLFLVLADILVRQKGGERPDQIRNALRILDQAADLGLQTRALDIRRSRYEEIAGTTSKKAEKANSRSSWNDSGFDHFLVGDDLYKQGKLVEAVGEFQKTLQLQPDSFWAHFDVAACYIMLGRPDLARENLNICLEKKRIVWVYLMRGYAEGLLKEYETAEQDFDDALKLLESDQNQEGYYVLYNNRGIMRIGAGQFAQGEADLRQAIQTNPTKYHAYLSLALAYFQKEEKDAAVRKSNLGEASTLIDQAIRVADESATRANLYRTLSQFHIKAENYQAALEDLDQSISLEPEASPTRAKAQIDRGRILQKRNRNDEALSAYDAALKTQPELVDAYRWRGETLFKLKRFSEAIQSFDQYLEKGGKVTAKVYESRAMARGQAKDHAGAVEDYSRALVLEKEPKEITGVLVNRGQAYLACQADQPALRDFEEVIKRDAGNSTAYLGRGFVRVRKGDIPQGVKDAEKAIQVDPKNPKTTYHAARIFAQAAGKMDSDKERSNRQAIDKRFYYQDRAVALIRRALLLLPEQQRERFWKENVAADSSLGAIRHTYAFSQLEEQYTPPKSRVFLNASTNGSTLSRFTK
jgi:tetratricopeptide (TPR) repeat protein